MRVLQGFVLPLLTISFYHMFYVMYILNNDRIRYKLSSLHWHRWSSDAGISRLGHPKMADAFPVKELRGRISPCIHSRHSPYLDHMTCIWAGMDGDNRIEQKRSIRCKSEGNKSWWDAGFSPSWFCHDADSSILGCRFLFGDAPSLHWIPC